MLLRANDEPAKMLPRNNGCAERWVMKRENKHTAATKNTSLFSHPPKLTENLSNFNLASDFAKDQHLFCPSLSKIWQTSINIATEFPPDPLSFKMILLSPVSCTELLSKHTLHAAVQQALSHRRIDNIWQQDLLLSCTLKDRTAWLHHLQQILDRGCTGCYIISMCLKWER